MDDDATANGWENEGTTITLFPTHWANPECHFPVVSTPVGATCFECGREIAADDRGLILPVIAESVTFEPSHRECFLRNILGPNWRNMVRE